MKIPFVVKKEENEIPQFKKQNCGKVDLLITCRNSVIKDTLLILFLKFTEEFFRTIKNPSKLEKFLKLKSLIF